MTILDFIDQNDLVLVMDYYPGRYWSAILDLPGQRRPRGEYYIQWKHPLWVLGHPALPDSFDEDDADCYPTARPVEDGRGRTIRQAIQNLSDRLCGRRVCRRGTLCPTGTPGGEEFYMDVTDELSVPEVLVAVPDEVFLT